MNPAPWPVELRHDARARVLHVVFDNGEAFALPAELLRVESPSAEVQGHGAEHKQIVAGKAKVAIRAIEPVGHYAVRIAFDDGHDTGLYTWAYLHALGRDKEAVWQRYLAALAARGLAR
ncbi:MAG: gamma-butyrobetaine hydroxylase-like domain-containing protein [Pseudomonadota bacterium]